MQLCSNSLPGPAHYIHCGGVSEYVEPKTQKKIKKLTTNQRQLVPTVRHELVVRNPGITSSWCS